MSWERFRCQTDCEHHPDECINERLFMEMADALVAGGYAARGYTRLHIDDCWSVLSGRDAVTGELLADPDRFPGGIRALAEYMHDRGLSLGIYGDAGTQTCQGYEGTLGHEDIDATTFAKWGVDYVKLDGCHLDQDDMEAAYTSFGLALKKVASTKKIVYSCSWAAAITIPNGGDESQVPYQKMYNQAGCNTWRNWRDMDNNWEKIKSIILHWADNWEILSSIPQGSFNDADMLISGDDRSGRILPVVQARLQFGFWALISSPLLIGSDVRRIPGEYRDILLNGYILSVNQDRLRNQAICVVGCKNSIAESSTTSSSSNNIQVWTKHLDGFSIQNDAFGFLNLGNSTAGRISYMFPLESKPSLMLCADLWSPDPSQSVCSSAVISSGGSLREEEEEEEEYQPDDDDDANNHWDFNWVESGDGSVQLEISALDVPPTSHRMLRIYFRSHSSLDENEITTFHDEVSKLALL
jgi:hypothetical protein